MCKKNNPDENHKFSGILSGSATRSGYPQVESHSSTCVVRSDGEVPTLEASPSSLVVVVFFFFFSGFFLFFLPRRFFSRFLFSFIVNLALPPFLPSSRLASPRGANDMRSFSLLCALPSLFFLSSFPFGRCLVSRARARARASKRVRARHYTPPLGTNLL